MTVQEYHYQGVDNRGVACHGAVSAESRGAALDVLSRRGLIPVSLEEAGDSGPRPRWLQLAALWARRPRRNVHQPEILNLTQSLASLVRAGLTIDRALQITASLTPRADSRALAEGLLREVRSGKSLHAALAGSGQRLPNYYVSMVEAGELGGSLADALARVAELMGRHLELRERIRSALIYPSLLAAVVIITLVVLLTFVLPRFEVLFAEAEARLPWSTRAVLWFGRKAADYWWVAVLSIVATVAVFLSWLRSLSGRRIFDRWLLRTRLTFGVPLALDTARLLRTVSALCSNGQQLTTALRVARGTLQNRTLQNALTTVTHEVQAGDSFSVALARAKCFPALAVQLARVGEETGHLGDMLQAAASVLEKDAQRLLERLLSIGVPLVTVAMGVVVAGLIGSVLIGLLSINDLAF